MNMDAGKASGADFVDPNLAAISSRQAQLPSADHTKNPNPTERGSLVAAEKTMAATFETTAGPVGESDTAAGNITS